MLLCGVFCLSRWMTTDWTACSRTCGKGSQNRQVACTQQLPNGTQVKARDRDCAGPKPASSQRCEGQDCLTVWEAGVWSEVRRRRMEEEMEALWLFWKERGWGGGCVWSTCWITRVFCQCSSPFSRLSFCFTFPVALTPSHLLSISPAPDKSRRPWFVSKES